MRKPRLTQKRLDGLGTIAGLIEAGPALEDTFGPESVAEVRAALTWIREMQAHRHFTEARRALEDTKGSTPEETEGHE